MSRKSLSAITRICNFQWLGKCFILSYTIKKLPQKGFTPLETIRRQKKDMMSLTGFTLMELFISVAIFTLILSGIFVVLASGKNYLETGEHYIRVQQELRRGMDFMVEELRESGPDTVTMTEDSITFRTPIGINGTQITWGNLIMYSVSQDQLLRTESGISRVLVNNLQPQGFTVTNPNPQVIEIALAVNSVTSIGRTVQAGLNFTVTLRN